MNKNRVFALFCLSYWVGLIIFIIFDLLGFFGSDIGFWQTLKQSSLARVMFMDIGALATVASAWIFFQTRFKFRILFAVLTLFVGSFVFLPYLAYYYWNKD